MATVTLKGNPIKTIGNLPSIGSNAPDFKLTRTDLSEVSLADFKGKKIILNIFHSIDTGTCAMSVKQFNAKAQSIKNTAILCISMDLPFAHKRFCGAEGLNDVIPLSVFRSPAFGKDYGVTMLDGPLAGILARSVVVLDETGKVVYTEQVPEVTEEPDYDKAMEALKKIS